MRQPTPRFPSRVGPPNTGCRQDETRKSILFSWCTPVQAVVVDVGSHRTKTVAAI
jgi:hypothetical protein